jgi:hypothetical protein
MAIEGTSSEGGMTHAVFVVRMHGVYSSIHLLIVAGGDVLTR